MLSRMGMIGEIRDLVERLYDEGRFEVVKETMGGIHTHDFSGISDDIVLGIWRRLQQLTSGTVPEKCHYCRTGQGAACNCV